jgi:hypothetical protein
MTIEERDIVSAGRVSKYEASKNGLASVMKRLREDGGNEDAGNEDKDNEDNEDEDDTRSYLSSSSSCTSVSRSIGKLSIGTGGESNDKDANEKKKHSAKKPSVKKHMVNKPGNDDAFGSNEDAHEPSPSDDYLGRCNELLEENAYLRNKIAQVELVAFENDILLNKKVKRREEYIGYLMTFTNATDHPAIDEFSEA